MRWSEQTMSQFAYPGLQTADWQRGYGMQYGGYEDDFGVGSGAQTPELENEHPLSRQTSTQSPTALMAMLTAFQNQHETQGREHMDASQRENAFVHGTAARSPMRQGQFGFGDF